MIDSSKTFYAFSGWSGIHAHPNSPQGAGGLGAFGVPSGSVLRDAFAKPGEVAHPRSPAGLRAGPTLFDIPPLLSPADVLFAEAKEAAAPPNVLTPQQFMKRYRSLTVRLDDNRQVLVDVHRYTMKGAKPEHDTHISEATWEALDKKMHEAVEKQIPKQDTPGQAAAAPSGHAAHAHDHHKADAQSKAAAAHRRAQVSAGVTKLITDIDPALSRPLLYQASLGKGSPAAVAVLLRLAARYGLAPDLQKFADGRNVGLDCSGFVSNYLVARGLLAPQAAGDRNADSYDVPARRRKTLESVSVFDVMVWQHPDHHVAIIDSAPVACVVPNPVAKRHAQGRRHAHGHGHDPAAAPPQTHTAYTCTVVESNGSRGLDSEEYTLDSVHQGLFTVRRHSKPEKDWHVYIMDCGAGIAKAPSTGPWGPAGDYPSPGAGSKGLG
jgi:hypothetical protein